MRFIDVSVTKLSKKDLTELSNTVHVVAISSNKEGKSYALHPDYKIFKGLADRLHKSGELSLAAGQTCLVRYADLGQSAKNKAHVLFIATGRDKKGYDQLGVIERLRRMGAVVMSKLNAEKLKTAHVHLDSFVLSQAELSVDAESAAYAFSEGMGLASYSFKKYLSKKKETEEKPEIHFVTSDGSRARSFEKGLDRAEHMVYGATLARDFGNEPSNELYPEAFADQLKSMAKENKLKITVLNEKDLLKEKMGLLLGVGQGSERPPRLVMIEYKSPVKTKKTIAFVGKGVTFDSGGISIKPSSRMEDMKHDMCGAAAVLGAVMAASKLKLKVNITAIVAITENMPDGYAIQPGNIIRSRAGKTVEITNTDAEGRLILADALDYIQDFNPDYIIDLATLTGAVVVTLGKSCAGLMGNDNAFNRLVKGAAESSGERVWELPMYEEYFDDLKSDFADMRNSGDTASHGTAKGAMFLKQFIRKGTKWVHLDIAAMAYNVSNIPYNPKKIATGYGVRLLIELAKKVSLEG